jgi:hypothetical protein
MQAGKTIVASTVSLTVPLDLTFNEFQNNNRILGELDILFNFFHFLNFIKGKKNNVNGGKNQL